MNLFFFASAVGIGFTSVAAQDAVNGSIPVLQGIDDKGPWGEPRAEFDTLLSSPNATGSFPIVGPNISAPISPSSTVDGWSWSIAVAADLPIANSSTWASQYGDKFYTGGQLSFNAPSSLLSSTTGQNLTVDDDWEICLFRWELRQAAYPAKLRADDGTCSSVLSAQCIGDMEKAVSENHRGTRCPCPRPQDIPSCAGSDDAAVWENGTCGGFFYNASAIREWADGKKELEAFGGNTAHDRGNVSAYNYMGSVAWPVMVSFGNGTEKTASMACVRAKDATEGSTAPTGDGLEEGQDDEQSIASRISGCWPALGALFIYYMLVFCYDMLLGV